MVSHSPSELEINIKFPTCWDGVNAEDLNGNHVAYSLECDGLENDGPNECYDFDCPQTHPVKVSVIKKVATNSISLEPRQISINKRRRLWSKIRFRKNILKERIA